MPYRPPLVYPTRPSSPIRASSRYALPGQMPFRLTEGSAQQDSATVVLKGSHPDGVNASGRAVRRGRRRDPGTAQPGLRHPKPSAPCGPPWLHPGRDNSAGSNLSDGRDQLGHWAIGGRLTARSPMAERLIEPRVGTRRGKPAAKADISGRLRTRRSGAPQ